MSKYITIYECDPVEALSCLDAARQNGLECITIEGHQVGTSSHRYDLFDRNRTCVACGRTGIVMRLQKDWCNADSTKAHFNLYDCNGVLMTVDHIVPKSKGGKDDIANYQTMCRPCNAKKGNKCLM